MADKNNLFSGVNEKDLRAHLTKYGAREKEIPADDYVFREGDEAKGLFILLDGAVEVEKNDFSGKRQMVNRFREKDTVFGEVYLFLEDRPYDFACRAVKDSRLIFVPKDAFDPARGAVAQQLVANMLRVLAKKAFFLNQKMVVLSAGSMEKRSPATCFCESHGGRFRAHEPGSPGRLPGRASAFFIPHLDENAPGGLDRLGWPKGVLRSGKFGKFIILIAAT